MIPIRTAVRLRGDYWACGLEISDPRGHRTAVRDMPSFSEECASRRYFAMREYGMTIADAAISLQEIADSKYGQTEF